MNHHIAGRKLGRTTDHKLAMLRNLVTSLITHDRLTTTEAKAKELKRIADRMITLGKKGTSPRSARPPRQSGQKKPSASSSMTLHRFLPPVTAAIPVLSTIRTATAIMRPWR